MKKGVYVIHEYDYEYKDNSVLGVCSSLKEVDRLVDEYYRSFETLSFTDIRDSNLVWSKVIEIAYPGGEFCKYKITIEYFIIDEL